MIVQVLENVRTLRGEGCSKKYRYCRRVELLCEICSQNRIVNWTPKIKEALTHECAKCRIKKLGKNNKGKTSATKGLRIDFSERKIGALYVNSSGYVEVYLGTDHNLLGRKDSYCLLHKLVASILFPAYDPTFHKIHHIDGDKTNNCPTNIFVCESTSHHRQIHDNLQSVAQSLVQKGVIKFNVSKQEYYLPDLDESPDLNLVNSEKTYVLQIKSLKDMAILSQADCISEGATTIPLGSRA